MFAERVLLACLVAMSGCATTGSNAVNPSFIARSYPVGIVTKQQIFDADPRWQPVYAGFEAQRDAVRALAAAPPGAHIDVFLGTWCGDSVREVSRFLRYVEAIERAPFTYRLIAVDRRKTAPGFTEGANIERVPTFVVSREGREVGRVIETAPTEIGADLAAMLISASPR